MEQTTLKYLRVLIPGIVILLGLYPIKEQLISNNNLFHSLDYNFLILFSIVLGAIYYQLNIQRLITMPSYYFIQKNIYNKIISLDTKLSEKQKKIVWSKKLYLDVFYNIIDNDKSLERKGYNVRFNGIFWTSSADISLISLIYWLIYKFSPILKDDGIKNNLLSFLFVLFLLSLILHIISVRKHIKLSNEQLKIISDRFKSKTIEELNKSLSNYSN